MEKETIKIKGENTFVGNWPKACPTPSRGLGPAPLLPLPRSPSLPLAPFSRSAQQPRGLTPARPHARSPLFPSL